MLFLLSLLYLPWGVAALHAPLYTISLHSSSSCCWGSLILIGPNHPTLTLLHTSGKQNVCMCVCVCCSGACLEFTRVTVIICSIPLCTSYRPPCLETMMCSLPHRARETQWICAISFCIQHWHKSKHASVKVVMHLYLAMNIYSPSHVQYVLYKCYRHWPKTAETTGTYYTPLLTHLTDTGVYY